MTEGDNRTYRDKENRKVRKREKGSLYGHISGTLSWLDTVGECQYENDKRGKVKR